MQVRIWVISLFLLTLVTSANAEMEQNPYLGTADAYLVKVDGQVVWSQNGDQPLPPASLTKLMTAMLAIEHGKLDEITRVSPAAAKETGSRLGLRVGDRYTVRSMLAATLIRSANDACHVLADHVAGNEAKFVRLMNERAQAIGLKNTHFTNACGHHHVNHYSTANEMADLGERLLRNPVAADLVRTESMVIRSTNGRRKFQVKNSNQLLGQYPGLLGVKTGYTPEAGKCLVAAAKRGETRVLIVLLNAPNRWNLATEMLDKAFTDVRQTAMLGSLK